MTNKMSPTLELSQLSEYCFSVIWCVSPSEPLGGSRSHFLFVWWKLAIEDKIFNVLHISFCVSGFGNLKNFQLHLTATALCAVNWKFKLKIVGGTNKFGLLGQWDCKLNRNDFTRAKASYWKKSNPVDLQKCEWIWVKRWVLYLYNSVKW